MENVKMENHIWLPVTKNTNVRELARAYNKLVKVIESCETEKHCNSACTYIDLFINKFELNKQKEEIYKHLFIKFGGKPFIFAN